MRHRPDPGRPGVVLVHGAWHDGSCWSSVVDELAGRGHAVRAVDLPSERPGAGADHYADVVVAAVRTLAGDARRAGRDTGVALVGHSLGGLTVPVAVQRLGARRVTATVLVAALLPVPGTSWRERERAGPGFMAPGFGRGQQRHDDGTTSWPAAAAATGLYAGVAAESSAATVAGAAAALRPQAWTVTAETTPLGSWPAVHTTGVVCTADRVVDAGRLRAALSRLPDTHLVELSGGHFPMLTRPAELADVIAAAACRSVG